MPTDLGVGALLGAVPRFRVDLLAEDHVGRVAQVVTRKRERADDASTDGDAVARERVGSVAKTSEHRVAAEQYRLPIEAARKLGDTVRRRRKREIAGMHSIRL